MSKRFLLVACFFTLMWPSKVSIPPPPPPNLYPVTSKFKFDYKQLVIAHRVERRLRRHGFSDELIAGALVNAYAESQFDVSAIGNAGERGIFQLNPKGLGHGMTINEMEDIGLSVERIVDAIQKNRKIMDLEENGGSVSDHVLAFCREIERPKNKEQKARDRIRLMQKIMID